MKKFKFDHSKSSVVEAAGCDDEKINNILTLATLASLLEKKSQVLESIIRESDTIPEIVISAYLVGRN